ncbi:unnamed protein product, partial [Meganyctiphanes norvegica]
TRSVIMKFTALVLLTIVHGGFGYFCYSCDNKSNTSGWYDETCGRDPYYGHFDSGGSGPNHVCYTRVHYDGSDRVEIYSTDNGAEDGSCYDTGFAIECYCKEGYCNEDLCQHCTTAKLSP